jgi:hypothetical protein
MTEPRPTVPVLVSTAFPLDRFDPSMEHLPIITQMPERIEKQNVLDLLLATADLSGVALVVTRIVTHAETQES